MIDTANIEKLVKNQHWFHSFEVAAGVWTPGKSGRIDPRRVLTERHGLPEDLTGLNALDIGALDGPYSFELERRGAKVTSIDIQAPNVTGFNVAKKIKASNARYIQGNVYDLVDIFQSQRFDIVLFFGVWHHLKNPFRAFDQINRICAGNAILCAEGECLLNYAEIDGIEVSPKAFIDQIANSELPLSLWYPHGFKGDQWSWSVPNTACVKAWVDAAAFEMNSFGHESSKPYQRMYITATKSARQINVDNPIW